MKKRILPIRDVAERQSSLSLFKKQVTKDTFNTLTQAKYSSSSLLAMTADWNRFVQFCDSKHVQPLPASITAVRLFLESTSREMKFSTIRRYSITIGLVHQLHSLPDPTNHRQVRFTLNQLKLLKQGDARQASALTQAHINALVQILLKEKSARALRDMAIYAVMFECALKRSDLKNMQIKDIIDRDKETAINVNDQVYQLSDQAQHALHAWLQNLPECTGFLFRRIDKHGNIGQQPLDDSSIYRILRRASDLLELDHEHRFGGQSARVGAAQELENQGYNLKDIQDFGRWLSPAMPAQYLKRTSTAEGEMAKFKRIKPWS